MKIHSAVVTRSGHLMLKGAIVLTLEGQKAFSYQRVLVWGSDILSPFPQGQEHDCLGFLKEKSFCSFSFSYSGN